jgi:hypothetical protein
MEIVNMSDYWNEIGKEATITELRHYSAVCLEQQGKTTNYFVRMAGGCLLPCLLLASCLSLHWQHFDPEDGSNLFLRYIGKRQPYLRRYVSM